MATAQTRVTPKDFLRVADLTPRQLERLLDLAAQMEDEPDGWVDALRGRSVACYFAKPSTRTRVSFAAAAARLGMNPIVLRPDELQLGRGEPIADTARALAAYCDAIVIRTYAQQEIAEMAAAAPVPVVNALSDDHHPCQALADVLTVREWFGRLAGIRLAYVGDGNNVVHSLLEAGALAGMEIAVASPPATRRAPTSSPARARSPRPPAARSSCSTTRARRCAARTPSTPTSGSRWATTRSATSGCACSARTRSTRSCSRSRGRRRSSSTASPPTAARRCRRP